MPRYLIERRYDPIGDPEMLALANRAKLMVETDFPEVTWEHSHVCADHDGNVVSYCIYAAPDEQMLREHSERLGQHTITAIYEIAADVDPAQLTG